MKKMLFKTYLVAVLSVLFLLSSVGFIFAYLSYFTGHVDNSFIVDSDPKIVINEEFVEGNSIKNNVNFTNDADYAVYFRVAILTTWKQSANGDVYGIPPVKNTDYTVDLNDTDWIKGSDGFYYYKQPVLANGKTTNLINELKKINESPADFPILSVEIIAQSIQAIGDTGDDKLPVEEAWGVTLENGNIVSK